MAKVSVRIPDDLIEYLDKEADNRGVNRTYVILQILEEHKLRREIKEEQGLRSNEQSATKD
jgi:predicted transcriptional regulator